MKLVIDEKEDEVHFCQSFVMLVLCIYLAPTTSLNINRSYYPALMDVTKIPFMDWCGYIADYLIQGIEDYRNSKAFHVQVPGCVHILPVRTSYLDRSFLPVRTSSLDRSFFQQLKIPLYFFHAANIYRCFDSNGSSKSTYFSSHP